MNMQKEGCCRDSEEEEDEPYPADVLFQRENMYEKLKELARQDEEARAKCSSSSGISASKNDDDDGHFSPNPIKGEEEGDDEYLCLPCGAKILNYGSYLKHQRYYDDLKHVDYKYIDYGNINGDSDSNISGGASNTSSSVPLPFATAATIDSTTATDHNKYMNTNYNLNQNRLLVEQDKALGKGGLCWDAAFILGEYLIYNANNTWRKRTRTRTATKIIELGCGTGLCGMLLAKGIIAAGCGSNDSSSSSLGGMVEIALTDLHELLPLLKRNVMQNFLPGCIRIVDEPGGGGDEKSDIATNLKKEEGVHVDGDRFSSVHLNATGSVVVSPFVLEWGSEDSQAYHGQYNVILGADVVATLYDPTALAITIYNLATDSTDTRVYVSFKERLSSVHRKFESEMERRFEHLEIIDPLAAVSCSTKHNNSSRNRNRNPSVRILVAWGKKLHL